MSRLRGLAVSSALSPSFAAISWVPDNIMIDSPCRSAFSALYVYACERVVEYAKHTVPVPIGSTRGNEKALFFQCF